MGIGRTAETKHPNHDTADRFDAVRHLPALSFSCSWGESLGHLKNNTASALRQVQRAWSLQDRFPRQRIGAALDVADLILVVPRSLISLS
jgi:hypothetical protein